MKQSDRIQIIGLGVFAILVTAMTMSGQFAAAASPNDKNCTISFSGSLSSFQMVPEGPWQLASSDCIVTSQSGGMTSGTFTGSFSSGRLSGTVSGTWSVAGSTQSVVASSTEFTLSFSTDQAIGQVPLLGSTVQGILSGTGNQPMFAVGTTGQITFA